MKVSPSFFREKAIHRLLERAAAVAATPMSLHFSASDAQEMYLCGWGKCAACAWINAYPQGAAACARSRRNAANMAMRQDVPVTFVCHLGFTCVIAPALPKAGYVLTLGPYIPADMSEAVDYDVAEGLRELETISHGDLLLPFELDDIRKAPAGVVSAVAEWLMEGLRDFWEESENVTEPEENIPDEEAPARKQDAQREEKTYTLGEINRRAALAALCLVCGHVKHARSILKSAIEEQQYSRYASPASLQARLTGLLSETIEIAQHIGGDVDPAWRAYATFVEEVRTCEDPDQMLHVATRVLRQVHPRPEKSAPKYLPDLIALVYKHYADNLALTGIAAEFGIASSTITRVLEHRIGSTFTEFLGQVRMEHACILLRNTQLSITNIGKRVGISDQSNFGKIFQKHIGIPPGQYRHTYQKEQ